VEGPEERYQFTWPDKRNAIRLANAPTTDTLRPCREESVNFDTTQNCGQLAPDWAIAFNDNMGVKHIFFIAETKGSMDSMQLKGIERAKIDCAKKLFNNMSTSKVRYHEVNGYDALLDVMKTLP